ncbi:MAG: FGGY-family carbohydrate kinase [Okeania sp. SIO2G4]|uniref:FGGY-family carbohydrate kinase n=1 Tax=unclassified Okeania TaxID=2634635 RepID=UPI0013BA12B5|nr:MULTISPECIES: FGGY-family carbohydrate kinase [unclassified Okeania]NEP06625.1 FGGY-family carbohydrate kinase [Okeania sp. SIO4D6]NEP76141.1 FGGY-family carbohydrate kinase [Okeania sp. SIO2G5]NEP97303.1 FGGY-family carbohydrate kinase [Okeania sp. SIO2F5]NEQ95039.1 FGGY-family carbohydrate kinase [Okeania sp. SIO2G4]
MNLYLGLDFGTSGARAVVIDSNFQVKAQTQYVWENTQQNKLPHVWQTALFNLISHIPQEMRGDIRAIAIDGTSATVLLCNSYGQPVTEALLYNDSRGVAMMDKLKSIAPSNHPVISATSSFAKLLWLIENISLSNQTYYFLHQADWLGFLLHGKLGVSDYNNVLKLGYDVGNLSYSNWLTDFVNSEVGGNILLPEVVTPGAIVGNVTPEVVNSLGLSPECVVCGGTTDSIAAFIASGANTPGEAVTSLGSTLVLKLLSRTRVDDAKYGIYSHRLGDLWLVGGASNTGGAVLRHFFTDAELENFSRQINPNFESGLDYYPLLQKGDRFPINDPELMPRLTPRPENPMKFLHGLLEGIAKIELRGYELLQALSAATLTNVYTAGGGAKNPIFTAIRGRYLQVPITKAVYTDAAYGSAVLASRQFIAQ